MLEGSLVLGTLILLSTPLKSDGYGRCESMAVCMASVCYFMKVLCLGNNNKICNVIINLQDALRVMMGIVHL